MQCNFPIIIPTQNAESNSMTKETFEKLSDTIEKINAFVKTGRYFQPVVINNIGGRSRRKSINYSYSNCFVSKAKLLRRLGIGVDKYC